MIVGPVTGHTVIGQFAGSRSPELEQIDCIRPLMHWQLHFACASAGQNSVRTRTAGVIFGKCVIRQFYRYVAAQMRFARD